MSAYCTRRTQSLIISVCDKFDMVEFCVPTEDTLAAHLGGFLMGLLVGTTFYPVISTSKRHKAIMWAFRIAALPIVIILFVTLVRNFYTSDPYAGTHVLLLCYVLG